LVGQTGVQEATPQQAIIALVNAWKAVSLENIQHAWDFL
jgi:hypothetical protein